MRVHPPPLAFFLCLLELDLAAVYVCVRLCLCLSHLLVLVLDMVIAVEHSGGENAVLV